MGTQALLSFLSGATLFASWTISFLFFRFRKTTGERLFGFFAAAFALLGIERIAIEFLSPWLLSYVYLIRLSAFLLILSGVLDKNRGDREPRAAEPSEPVGTPAPPPPG